MPKPCEKVTNFVSLRMQFASKARWEKFTRTAAQSSATYLKKMNRIALSFTGPDLELWPAFLQTLGKVFDPASLGGIVSGQNQTDTERPRCQVIMKTHLACQEHLGPSPCSVLEKFARRSACNGHALYGRFQVSHKLQLIDMQCRFDAGAQLLKRFPLRQSGDAPFAAMRIQFMEGIDIVGRFLIRMGLAKCGDDLV